MAVGSAARSVVKDATWLIGGLRKPEPGITFLLYHRVGVGSGSVIDLDPAEFERQMQQISDRQRVLSIDEALVELSAADGRSEPGLVVTFDDGTTDFVDHALPIMDRYEIPSTLYVATGLVSTDRPWPDGGRPITRLGLAEVAASKLVTLGSHTHTHKLLDRLPAADLADELDRSIEVLGEVSGIEVAHFAYPKAVAPSSAAAVAVAQRFRSAALAEPGPNVRGQDPQRLRRTPVQSTDRQRHLDAKFVGGMTLEAALRTRLNRVRYRDRVD